MGGPTGRPARSLLKIRHRPADVEDMARLRVLIIAVWAFVPFALFGAACVAGTSGSSGGHVETVSYANCDAVKAAGKAPLHKGDPGYSTSLDRDGDGTACDTTTTTTAAGPQIDQAAYAQCLMNQRMAGVNDPSWCQVISTR